MDVARPKQNKRAKRLSWTLLAIAALALITLGAGRMRRAPRSIAKSAAWTGEVKSGEMMRAVRGPGTLVPEHIRFVTADTAGRVERIHLRPGAEVEEETVLIELSNPDVQLAALEAERQVANAEAELLSLRSTLESELLTERAASARLKNEAEETARLAKANAAMQKQNLISELEATQSSEKAQSLKAQLALAESKANVLEKGLSDRLAAQKEQILKLRAVSKFRSEQVESMKVRARDHGVLQDLPLELGQWVTPGTLLAKVVRPDRLKAELRIAETQAKDLALGQTATIDTRNGIIKGKVSRIPPSATQGMVLAEISFDCDELPKGARPDLSVDGTIELEKIEALHVARPAGAQSESTMDLWKVIDGGDAAERVRVELGRSSVNEIEIKRGLEPGDRILLSDMTAYATEERVKIQ